MNRPLPEAKTLYLGDRPTTFAAAEAMANGIVHSIEQPQIPAGAACMHRKPSRMDALGKP